MKYRKGGSGMNRGPNYGSRPNSNGQIPQRVENAAQNMMNQASSGPRRGYIPPDTGRMQQMNGWQQTGGQGYYAQNQQQFYSGQSPVTGSQRGFIMPPAQNNRPKEPKKSHKGLIAFLVILLLVVLGTGGYFAGTQYMRNKEISEKVEPYDGLFCPGVYVDGIHLGGMTPEQALNSVQSQIQQRHDAWKVQLLYNGTSIAEIDADMLEFSVDPRGILQEAWLQGHTGDQEQRYEAMLQLEQQPYSAYTAQPSGNTEIIDTKLAQIKAAIDTPAVNAELIAFDPSLPYPFDISDEAYGRSLDTEPIKQKLYQMVSTMESGSVELIPDRVEPTVRKADLMKSYMLRSYASTPIDKHSTDDRNNNIRRAFEFINGYQLEPGKTFSFNGVVGERTPENGFFPAIEYVYGEHVEGYGGGVCQASTTLYQAAVCAGLQILKREPHSDKVSYTDLGKDATVYWFGKRRIDLTFRNNTDSTIYIVAAVKQDSSNKKRLNATVAIYGQDMGDVRYEIESEITETIPAPFNPVYKKDTNGTYVTYKDQQESVSKAKEGYVVKSYLVEYTSGVQTNRKLLYTDRYDEKAEIIYVGVKDRN